MLFFKRCLFFYDASLLAFNVESISNNLSFSFLLRLHLRFFQQFSGNSLFFLNNYQTIVFFSIKNFLPFHNFYAFRVLKIYGLGFKISIAPQLIKLDMGWSHALFKHIPSSIVILKKQDKLLVYGVLKHKVFNFANVLISLYERSAYQIKGLFDIHEKIKKKVGKQRQK